MPIAGKQANPVKDSAMNGQLDYHLTQLSDRYISSIPSSSDLPIVPQDRRRRNFAIDERREKESLYLVLLLPDE